MKEKQRFTEKQKFDQWWLWLLLACILIINIYLIYENHAYLSRLEIFFMIFIPVFLILLFAVLRLDTEIDENGVQMRFYPFGITFRYYPWREIRKIHVRKYSPLTEYGGWGIGGFFGRGLAYNVKGNMGIQMILNNDKRVLIGTQKPEEVEKFLSEIKW